MEAVMTVWLLRINAVRKLKACKWHRSLKKINFALTVSEYRKSRVSNKTMRTCILFFMRNGFSLMPDVLSVTPGAAYAF